MRAGEGPGQGEGGSKVNPGVGGAQRAILTAGSQRAGGGKAGGENSKAARSGTFSVKVCGRKTYGRLARFDHIPSQVKTLTIGDLIKSINGKKQTLKSL